MSSIISIPMITIFTMTNTTDFLNVTKCTQAEVQSKILHQSKHILPVHFEKLKRPDTPLPSYITQIYLLISKFIPIYFSLPTNFISK